MRLIILGPPGAGKGTQAARLAERLSIPAISTGDIFRSNIKDETELGLKVKDILASGGYVPDEVTNEIVEDRLGWDDASRRLPARRLPPHRRPGRGARRDARSPRATGSTPCSSSRSTTTPSSSACSSGPQTEGRADDTEDVIRERQAIYYRETAPLSHHYDEVGLLVRVDGMGELDKVTDRLVEALPAHSSR